MTDEREHLDLFSGIGGFALAAKWAGFKTRAFAEIEPYARGVLARRFPGIPLLGDVREINGRDYRGIKLITGGFPCQPWSRLGYQRGEKDERNEWEQVVRICREAEPDWIVCENVYGIVKVGLDIVHADLESMGYASGTLVLPACAVNAPHRRERVFIIAHSSRNGFQGRNFSRSPEEKRAEQEKQLMRCNRIPRHQWEALASICGVVDGLPNRSHRIRALGNALVPQLAFEILNLIP